ncbi:M23 family metallopeptidase [Mesorhizobium sp. B3-1-7]|nr:M23 family metallopeptidase [Mesorhizobium sp. B3-1-7]
MWGGDQRGEIWQMAVPIVPAAGKYRRGHDGNSGAFRHRGIDLSHGPLAGIHWQERTVRFAFRTHARLVLAIMVAAIGATGMLLGTLRVAVRPPVFAQAIPAKPQRTRQGSTPKDDRLPPPHVAGADAIANLVEAGPNGSANEFTYRHVEVSLGNPSADDQSDAAEPLLFQEYAVARPSPFDALLAKPRTDASSNRAPSAVPRPMPGNSKMMAARGTPINVSMAAEQPAPHIKRVAAMPKSDVDVAAFLAAAGLSNADGHLLADALKEQAIAPSDRVDLMLETPASKAGTAQLAAVRVLRDNGAEAILARSDAGGFRPIANHDWFDRLAAEATEAGFHAEGMDGLDADGNVSQLRAKYPLVMQRLEKEKVPPAVASQIIGLARNCGLKLDGGSADAHLIELIFRTRADGSSELVSARFDSGDGGKTFYRYRPSANEEAEFFDDQGRSVSKMMMAKPVANGRLGDGFAWRLHPILRRWLHHNGVDYAAPYGSPIVAAGDGKVAIIGWQPGYGKYVRLQHDGGYFTTYAHISRVPATLQVGQYVKQGQVIAYIGSTGLSTGPHLYYELRIGGRYYDPTSVRLTAGTRLTGQRFEALRKQIDHVGRISRYLEQAMTAVPKDRGHLSHVNFDHANALAAPARS